MDIPQIWRNSEPVCRRDKTFFYPEKGEGLKNPEITHSVRKQLAEERAQYHSQNGLLRRCLMFCEPGG